jgi:hypothetical protein
VALLLLATLLGISFEFGAVTLILSCALVFGLGRLYELVGEDSD